MPKRKPLLALDNLRAAALDTVKAYRKQSGLGAAIDRLEHVATRSAGKPGISTETIDLIQRLRAEGKTVKEIAEVAHVSTQTVVRHSRKP